MHLHPLVHCTCDTPLHSQPACNHLLDVWYLATLAYVELPLSISLSLSLSLSLISLSLMRVRMHAPPAPPPSLPAHLRFVCGEVDMLRLLAGLLRRHGHQDVRVRGQHTASAATSDGAAVQEALARECAARHVQVQQTAVGVQPAVALQRLRGVYKPAATGAVSQAGVSVRLGS